MHQFDYFAPCSLDEALEQLQHYGDQARPLAGGTDLLDHMRVGRIAPQVIIDIKKIPELTQIVATAESVRVGAAVPCYRIYGEPVLSTDVTAVAEACQIIGGVQIQSRASLGGNLCNSGPAADSAPAMIAMGGVCIVGSRAGRREIPVESFCTAPGRNVLQPGELLIEFRFPRGTRCGSHYRRMIPRNEMDIAVVGVGARLELAPDATTITAARIGLGAVAPTPLLAQLASDTLIGRPANASTFADAAQQARDAIAPISDMRGTREYRLHATHVLVRRVLEVAAARARGEQVTCHLGPVRQ